MSLSGFWEPWVPGSDLASGKAKVFLQSCRPQYGAQWRGYSIVWVCWVGLGCVSGQWVVSYLEDPRTILASCKAVRAMGKGDVSQGSGSGECGSLAGRQVTHLFSRLVWTVPGHGPGVSWSWGEGPATGRMVRWEGLGCEVGLGEQNLGGGYSPAGRQGTGHSPAPQLGSYYF